MNILKEYEMTYMAFIDFILQLVQYPAVESSTARVKLNKERFIFTLEELSAYEGIELKSGFTNGNTWKIHIRYANNFIVLETNYADYENTCLVDVHYNDTRSLYIESRELHYEKDLNDCEMYKFHS